MKKALTSLAAALLAACAVTAIAQPQTTKDGKRIGTRDEYRTCLNNADEVEQRQDALRTRSAPLAKEKKALPEEAPELSAEVKRANDDGVSGVRRTRLERRVKEHDARLKTAREQEDALNKDVEGLNKFIEDYRGRCTGVAFGNDDIEAVKKERAAAGKK